MDRWDPIELTSTFRPVLEPQEAIQTTQDQVGLYDGYGDSLLAHSLFNLLKTMCLACLSFNTPSHKTCFLITLYLSFKTEKRRESRLNYSHNTIVSLYLHRRVKAEDYPNGTVYLTNYRILYIDAKDPARKSIGLPLRLINGIQHYVCNNSDFVNTFASNTCMPRISLDEYPATNTYRSSPCILLLGWIYVVVAKDHIGPIPALNQL